MTTAPDIQAVVFGLDDEVFALPVEAVREILDHRPAFRLPHAPDWLLGLIDVRGESMPMVDLKVRLGRTATTVTAATRILVVDAPVDGRRVTLGLAVDRVLEVGTFAAAEIEAAPDIGTGWRADEVAGVARRNGGFVVHLALGHVFAGDAAAALAADLRPAA